MSSFRPVREPDLFNPHKFALTRVNLKRQAGQSLGFTVTFVASGVFRVVKVVDGEAASKAGIEKDMYLLSVDGNRLKNEAEFKEIDKGNRRSFRMAFVKKRSSSLNQDSFPLPGSTQRHAGHQYFLFR